MQRLTQGKTLLAEEFGLEAYFGEQLLITPVVTLCSMLYNSKQGCFPMRLDERVYPAGSRC